MSWYVLKVKFRSEKKVADTLTKMNIQVFCPMVKETRYWSDRKKTIEAPLFKSYVFVQLEYKYRGLVFGVSGVERYLFWLGKPAIVQDKEIETIKQWLAHESNDVLALSKLIPGSVITIKKGLLKNQEAVIQRVGKKDLSFLLKEMGIVAHAKITEIM